MNNALTLTQGEVIRNPNFMVKEGWYDDARCAADPDFMFLREVKSRKQRKSWPVLEVCTGCVALQSCLADALKTDANDDKGGVRGGMLPAERRFAAAYRLAITAQAAEVTQMPSQEVQTELLDDDLCDIAS
jgi:hypothetical protein